MRFVEYSHRHAAAIIESDWIFKEKYEQILQSVVKKYLINIRKDNFMEKWKKRYISITATLFVIYVVVVIFFKTNIDQLSPNVVELAKTVLVWSNLLFAIAMIIFFAICAIGYMKRGIHNIKNFDQEPFNNIDKYKKCWREENNYYIRQLQIINLYYKGGKVDELVNNQEIQKLFERADFLSVQATLFDNLITCSYSLMISVIASFLCQMMECNDLMLIVVWIVVIVLSFFGIVLIRYAEKGQAGSYMYWIDEYERNLLSQKIKELENKLVITADDEQILETKQTVINELNCIREKKKLTKQKEKVERDIKQVDQLNLCMGDYSKCYKKKIFINGIECCLVYDKEKGKENNYIGQSNLISEDFSVLYEILSNYELVSYYKS